MTQGKKQGLDAVSDQRGVIRAAAMDQRGSLRTAIADAQHLDSAAISDEVLVEFKTAVIRILSPHASGVLLDPDYGLPASRAREEGVGLLLSYERSGYDNSLPGRMPELMPGWTVNRLKQEGADGIKLLIYYTPFEKPSLNDQKKALVQQVGEECCEHDVPFFLEFVGYDPEGTLSSLEFARKKPDIVAHSMREFSQDQYQVDILKVEFPVNLQFTSGTRWCEGSEVAYSREEACELYLNAAYAARRPFIYLSAGVSSSQYQEGLHLALDAGVRFSGVLCGRATWKGGIPVYAQNGLSALEDWLSTDGVGNIRALNAILAGACSWKDYRPQG
ncbi:MAG: tagatose 1,6-diphosphate aldolase [Acidobacteriota bacterium]